MKYYPFVLELSLPVKSCVETYMTKESFEFVHDDVFYHKYWIKASTGKIKELKNFLDVEEQKYVLRQNFDKEFKC